MRLKWTDGLYLPFKRPALPPLSVAGEEVRVYMKRRQLTLLSSSNSITEFQALLYSPLSRVEPTPILSANTYNISPTDIPHELNLN